jgi:hypothetical protein
MPSNRVRVHSSSKRLRNEIEARKGNYAKKK